MSFKPNAKEFKEFNSELFHKYIGKFKKEDKLAAIHILIAELAEDEDLILLQELEEFLSLILREPKN